MLTGKKVILEEVAPENIEQLRKWRNNPELRQWFREYKDISVDKQAKWYAERGNNLNPDHVYFQIMEKNPVKNVLAGCCGLHYIDFRLRKAEFGVFLGPDFRGMGLGKEALTMMFDYGFNELNLHKIWCEVYEGNDSINLYRKLGFKDEGVLRDNWFHNGHYGNSIMMSVLETEWRK